MVIASINSYSDPLFGITWSSIFFLWWGIGILTVLALLLLRWYVFYKKRIRVLASPEREKYVLKNFSWSRLIGKGIVAFFAAFFLCIALLRPQWGDKNDIVVQEGRSIVFALDISRSMAAEDSKPSRIEAAKEKIRKVIDRLQADQVALIVFSGDALISCPLTVDYDAFKMLLDDSTVETASAGSTNVTAAMMKIIDVFGAKTGDRETRLAVLLTDGENFSSGIEDAGDKLKKAGIRLCTVGMGSVDGAPIPLLSNNQVVEYQKDRQGHVVVSRLNETLLQELAQVTGGKTLIGKQDDSEIESLIRWVAQFEKKTRSSRREKILEDRYYYYAAVAGVFLVINLLM